MKFSLQLFISICVSLGIFNSLQAQELTRSAVIFDMTERNSETNDGRLFSCEQMLDIAGVPYLITDDLSEAVKHKVLLMTSQIKNNFTDEERFSIEQYVTDGGVLLAPRVNNPDFYHIFGITEVSSTTENFRINFNPEIESNLFEYINDTMEWEISLGKPSLGETYKTYQYVTEGATELAHYESGTTAISVNDFGAGKAYAFGIPWKDHILRNQIMRHYEAQRVKSNNFEPSQDVIQLLMRTIYNDAVPYSTWKHTSIANSSSTLMITHDIDSRTAVDSLPSFSASEKAMDIKATYNVTLRYFRDSLMSDFYNGSYTNLQNTLADGHIIGSHSVGHFFDFDSDDDFALGSTGNTRDNYEPFNAGDFTFGGTVYGECEVGKLALKDDHDVDVRTFRTGHLVFHRYLINVLDSLGYEYNSSTTCNGVLSNFPFNQKMSRSFSGLRSSIYEFPISISDVFHDNPISNLNYIHKAVQWLDVTGKVDDNHGTHTLLIHPNRGWKLIGQEYYLAHLRTSIAIKEMGEFGDYWKARKAVSAESILIDNNLEIRLNTSLDNLHEDISFVIEDGQGLANITMIDVDGIPVEFMTENWKDNDIIIYQYDVLFVDNLEIENELGARIFPNPSETVFNVRFELPTSSNVTMELLDIQGKSLGNIYFGENLTGQQTICFNVSELKLQTGIYFCNINAGINGRTVKKIIVR